MSPRDLASLDLTELPEIPGYRLIAPVGGGSRATVYRARELGTQELVALKAVDAASLGPTPHGAPSPLAIKNAVARLAEVDSPVLVKPRKVIESTSPGGPVVVMEFVDGDSLAQRLGRSLRLEPAKAVGVAAEVARGLGAAFEAGMVHGDLHPGKIILSGRTARLLGAGLAETLPAEFETPGTSGRVSPHVYAADEVLAGDPPSAASDVFSLGAVLYHMLTGHAPWDPSTLAAVRVARADGPPVWPRGASELIPAALMGLVDRMTSRDPAGRPAGGWVLAEALESALTRTTRRVRPPARPVLEEVPRGVAPVEVGVAGEDRASAAAGLLRRVGEWLARPSAVRVIVGGATAVFLLAVALALRGSRERGTSSKKPGKKPGSTLGRSKETPAELRSAGEGGRTRGEVVREEAPTGAGTGEATPGSPGPVEAALREVRAIEDIVAENPGDVALFRERLEALRSEPGQVGARATLLLARVREGREGRAEEALRRLADRAAALEAGGRYGEAVAALEQFPFGRFGDTPAAERARLEADAVRGRAAEAFAGVERATEPLLAKGEFAAARAEYEYMRDTVGLAVWVERAEEALARIGRTEEEVAEAEAARRAAKAKAQLASEVEDALAELPRLCRHFRYSKAERTLDAVLAKPITERDRKRLSEYGEFVRREAEQFRLAAERLRSGELLGRLSLPGVARQLIVRDITEDGLDLLGLEGNGRLTTRVGWGRFSPHFHYKCMLELANKTAFEERIALAVFAYHRDLSVELENELRVAKILTQSRWARELLARSREFTRVDRSPSSPVSD